jgi:hypothetical protein
MSERAENMLRRDCNQQLNKADNGQMTCQAVMFISFFSSFTGPLAWLFGSDPSYWVYTAAGLPAFLICLVMYRVYQVREYVARKKLNELDAT